MLKNSRIPMLQRTPSLRLKGEKVFSSQNGPDLPNNGGNELVKGKLDVLRTKNRGVRLTRSASMSEKLHLHDNRTKELNKPTSNGQQLEINISSEYESLPSTPVLSPDVDDLYSLTSFRSCSSTMSLEAPCSGHEVTNKKKFVVHCQHNHLDQEDYLTPTQRKDRQIRQLKAQLVKAKHTIVEKDAEILLLTKEVINLRINKSKSHKEAERNLSNEVHLNEIFHSNDDSGLCERFDDCGEGNSKGREETLLTDTLSVQDSKYSRPDNMEEFYKKELEEVKRNHYNDYQELKEKYNDRMEALLQKLSDANIKYFDLRPKYDRAQEVVKQQESRISMLEKELEDQDRRHHQMYLKMYKKGQEAAKFEHADEVLEFAHQAPKRVSVPELLQQLKVTEHELDRVKALYRREIYSRSDSMESEMTLGFLKDVIYHFLTNKDSSDHLRAIENIMGYSDAERLKIERSVFGRNPNNSCEASNLLLGWKFSGNSL